MKKYLILLAILVVTLVAGCVSAPQPATTSTVSSVNATPPPAPSPMTVFTLKSAQIIKTNRITTLTFGFWWTPSPSPGVTNYLFSVFTNSPGWTNIPPISEPPYIVTNTSTTNIVIKGIIRGCTNYFYCQAENSSQMLSQPAFLSISGFYKQEWFYLINSNNFMGTNWLWAQQCTNPAQFFKLHSGELQSSPDLVNWTNVIAAPANSGMIFQNNVYVIPWHDTKPLII